MIGILVKYKLLNILTCICSDNEYMPCQHGPDHNPSINSTESLLLHGVSGQIVPHSPELKKKTLNYSAVLCRYPLHSSFANTNILCDFITIWALRWCRGSRCIAWYHRWRWLILSQMRIDLYIRNWKTTKKRQLIYISCCCTYLSNDINHTQQQRSHIK